MESIAKLGFHLFLSSCQREKAKPKKFRRSPPHLSSCSLLLLLMAPFLVLFWLVFSTFNEVLFIVLYDLSRPNLQLLHCGSSAPVLFYSKLSASSALVAKFVKDFRSDFFNFLSSLRWILPLMRHPSALIGPPYACRLRPLISLRPSHWLAPPMLLIFGFYCCFYCFMSFCYLVWFFCFIVLMLVPLFASLPSTDYYSAFLASITFRWLLLVPSGGLDLVWTLFAFVTALSGPLRGPGHLYDQFSTLCIYCCAVLVCFGFVVGEPTPLSFFSFFGSPTSSSFRIKSGKDHSL